MFSLLANTWCPLRWRHNGRDDVSNHPPQDCSLNHLGTGEFPAQMASNAENVSIWWRHHVCDIYFICQFPTSNWSSWWESHHGDVIMSMMASQITSPRLFTQQFIEAQFKENIKAPCHWLLCRKLIGDRWFPHPRANNAENICIWWRHHVILGNIVFILKRPHHFQVGDELGDGKRSSTRYGRISLGHLLAAIGKVIAVNWQRNSSGSCYEHIHTHVCITRLGNDSSSYILLAFNKLILFVIV